MSLGFRKGDYQASCYVRHGCVVDSDEDEDGTSSADSSEDEPACELIDAASNVFAALQASVDCRPLFEKCTLYEFVEFLAAHGASVRTLGAA